MAARRAARTASSSSRAAVACPAITRASSNGCTSVAPGSKAPLAPLLRKAAADGRLGGEVHAGLWSDVGTPERLAELNRAFTRTESP